LVTKGYIQQKGIDFYETFSPTLRMDLNKNFTALAAQNEFNIHQIDVNAAYFNAHLKEKVFMNPPKGRSDYGKYYWRLNKAIYGLKQMARSGTRN